MNLFVGKGDLVGSDISLHLQNQIACQTTGNPSATANASGDIIIKSSSDVRALTYCDLKCINMQGLVEVLRLYPEYQQQFANDIHHDLTFNVREGYEAEVSFTFNFELSFHFSFKQQESEVNGVPSLTLPSISEDDENAHEDNENCPLSPNRSPLQNSPRHKLLR